MYCSLEGNCIYSPIIISFPIQIKLKRNIRGQRNFISEAKIKNGTFYICTYNSRKFSRKLTPTVFEIQHLRDIEMNKAKQKCLA